jgi:predicted TIM-barrel fold metal-dependent hydrolase
MKIVDAQVHIWTSGTPVHVHRQVSAYTAAELLHDMDEAGVDGAVLHPPSWDANANQVAIEAAQAAPERLSVLAFFDVTAADAREQMQRLLDTPGVLGLRFAFLKPAETGWLTDGSIDWLWPVAERAGTPVGLLVPKALDVVDRIATRHPGLPLMIDHMARLRSTQDEASFADLDKLLALARHPNVAVKATGAPSYSSQPYPYRNIQPYMRQIFEAFGPHRMFWGTDITRMPCSWRQCVTLFTEELDWLKGQDLELVMGKALCEWIGWDAAAS